MAKTPLRILVKSATGFSKRVDLAGTLGIKGFLKNVKLEKEVNSHRRPGIFNMDNCCHTSS